MIEMAEISHFRTVSSPTWWARNLLRPVPIKDRVGAILPQLSKVKGVRRAQLRPESARVGADSLDAPDAMAVGSVHPLRHQQVGQPKANADQHLLRIAVEQIAQRFRNR